MYDPDVNRYDSMLGDVPMMRPVREYNPAHVMSYAYFDTKLIEKLPEGWVIRCFAPCPDQLAGRPCPCTERIKAEVQQPYCEACGDTKIDCEVCGYGQ